MNIILKRLNQLEDITDDVYSIEMFSDGSGTLYCYHDTEEMISESDKYILSFLDLEDLIEQLDDLVKHI